MGVVVLAWVAGGTFNMCRRPGFYGSGAASCRSSEVHSLARGPGGEASASVSPADTAGRQGSPQFPISAGTLQPGASQAHICEVERQNRFDSDPCNHHRISRRISDIQRISPDGVPHGGAG